MLRRLGQFAVLTVPVAAWAQQAPPTDWQALALRSQQNATVDQMIASGIISALQTENAELKGELAKLRKPDPPEPPK